MPAELSNFQDMKIGALAPWFDSKCERCHRHALDQVHHLTYIRIYHEELEDLQGICRGCHEFTHGRSDIDPATQPGFTMPDILKDARPPRPKTAAQALIELAAGGRAISDILHRQ